MTKVSFFAICGLFMILISSCKDRDKNAISEQLNDLYGKKIEFVHQDRYVINGRDTVIAEDKNTCFKIVVFADSLGCQPCNLRLGELGLKVREIKYINENVHFVIIVQNSDYHSFEHDAHHNIPDFPFVYDPTGLFLTVNDLPDDNRFHSFLLDRNNKILLVGNPLGNDNLWELYKRQIRELTAKE